MNEKREQNLALLKALASTGVPDEAVDTTFEATVNGMSYGPTGDIRLVLAVPYEWRDSATCLADTWGKMLDVHVTCGGDARQAPNVIVDKPKRGT